MGKMNYVKFKILHDWWRHLYTCQSVYSCSLEHVCVFIMNKADAYNFDFSDGQVTEDVIGYL